MTDLSLHPADIKQAVGQVFDVINRVETYRDAVRSPARGMGTRA